MDQFLSDLTRDLPGWLGIVLVVVVVGGGWFGISRLGAWAARSAQQRAARAAARERARAARPWYATSPAAVAAETDAFALAASAWLAHTSQQPLELFAYANPDALEPMLARYYDVHDRDDLEAELVRLLVEGHRAWPHGDSEGPIDFAVWDLVRVIELSRSGLGLGVMTEADARDTARFAAQTLQARYSDWPSLGAHLERAYRHTHEKAGRHTIQLARIECDGIRTMLQAPDGPWALVPWSTPIPHGELRILPGPFTRVRHPSLTEPWEQPIAARQQAG